MIEALTCHKDRNLDSNHDNHGQEAVTKDRKGVCFSLPKRLGKHLPSMEP